jgi:hypothetical protein
MNPMGNRTGSLHFRLALISVLLFAMIAAFGIFYPGPVQPIQ